MACDFSALLNLDASDPLQAQALLQECTATLTDPKLWLWAIVFTIVCAGVGAWIGRRRNTVVRDAIMGAALGPIGWIISAFLPAAKPKAVCSACQCVADHNDKYCRKCGAKLAS